MKDGRKDISRYKFSLSGESGVLYDVSPVYILANNK